MFWSTTLFITFFPGLFWWKLPLNVIKLWMLGLIAEWEIWRNMGRRSVRLEYELSSDHGVVMLNICCRYDVIYMSSRFTWRPWLRSAVAVSEQISVSTFHIIFDPVEIYLASITRYSVFRPVAECWECMLEYLLDWRHAILSKCKFVNRSLLWSDRHIYAYYWPL